VANKKITELTSATTPLAGTELVEVIQAGANRKVTVSNFTGSSSPVITMKTASVSAGTMALNMNSESLVFFLVSTTISANFAITFSNSTGNLEGTLHLFITGTVAITVPSACMMYQSEKDGGRWNDSTNVLTLIGTTAQPFTLKWMYDTTNFRLMATPGFI
jgi:hypothetical protein